MGNHNGSILIRVHRNRFLVQVIRDLFQLQVVPDFAKHDLLPNARTRHSAAVGLLRSAPRPSRDEEFLISAASVAQAEHANSGNLHLDAVYRHGRRTDHHVEVLP
jgi:hypothetical protein